MLLTTVMLFALAAVLGVVLIIKVFKDEETPKAVVYSHGGAAALALVLLIITYMKQGESLLLISLLIFVVAALGGFVMFGLDISKKSIPKWLSVVHALAAVTGFILLLYAAFGA
ncbi:hypothetical protein [Fodinibius halophilus]|uniref:DUF420 domain-containing protein n=1 Tax=Fodinibius halophilus TaxID=1736908 RepID=A0A6M1T3H1_9BACT|nr:hypothetical protein [Fodinibius halophilus]NGP88619.1 hypothetical protein [Fodinibius halophilus]